MPAAPAADVRGDHTPSSNGRPRPAYGQESQSGEPSAPQPKTFNPYKRFLGKDGQSAFFILPQVVAQYQGLSLGRNSARALYRSMPAKMGLLSDSGLARARTGNLRAKY